MNTVEGKMNKAVVIGDSSHNTLSVVRSLGIAEIPFILILKHNKDTCNVKKSKHLKHNAVINIQEMSECDDVLANIKDGGTIICTFDEAAEWIDEREPELSTQFITPCRGNQIGNLFNKDAQCELARACGLIVPESRLFHRGDRTDTLPLPYPVMLKPLYSTKGEKSDIHICHNRQEVEQAMACASRCDDFILQEFIEKEYELDCIGVRTKNETIVAGAVKKIRHYPDQVGAGAYGIFLPLDRISIDITALSKFMATSNYHGPFSVEFLRSKGKNYFMEVNFRNEGLAQVATDAGVNLHAKYVDENYPLDLSKTKSIYMMNYSIDYLHVKEGRVGKARWWRDFLSTRCFINFSPSDPMPTISHYLNKMRR